MVVLIKGRAVGGRAMYIIQQNSSLESVRPAIQHFFPVQILINNNYALTEVSDRN